MTRPATERLPWHFLSRSLRSAVFAICAATASAGIAQVGETDSELAAEGITLDRIMSDPQWLGRPPENAYWSDDGQSFYYQREREGSKISDWFEADLQGNLIRVVQDKDLGGMDSSSGRFDRKRERKVYESSGDVFIKNQKKDSTRQLTRTIDRESAPQFMADQRRVMFRRGDSVLTRDLESGLEQDLVDLRFQPDPEVKRQKDAEGYLPEQQQRLFDTLRTQRQQEDEAEKTRQSRQASDPTRVPLPWYLGDDYRPEMIQVSPNGKWCVIALRDKNQSDGESDKMPEFVSDDGYVNIRTVRSLVGTGKADCEKLLLLDLVRREKHELSFTELPEYDSDPLADLRGESTGDEGDDDSEAPKEKTIDRAIQVVDIQWNDIGDRVAIQLQSADNKDRWIAEVDFKAKKLDAVMHRRDTAWIGWDVMTAGWLPDQQSFYFLSEATGYAQLYVAHLPSGSTRQLTRGDFVVSDVQIGSDGRFLYYKANSTHPGIYEVFRVEVASGQTEQLTSLGGMNDYVLSDDQQHLLVTHSTALSPPELWVQPIGNQQQARQVTRTVSAEFESLPWIAPKFVTIESRAGRPIHARLYLPPGDAGGEKRPAVIFIHGAGYLQNAHQGWSGYFREFMFNSLLAHRGYVVLDMDYRASAGYGRDWRTAIYRHMGGPEVEDLDDGLQWLVRDHGVDADRVGLYGGSYGGFLTMMALFKHPGKFACGAALRPVTDWAHYNHGYTSNILNTPEVDPEAYARSSPIEFASGLEDPLLICHGMVDDNVFFKDTARLAQRLIELKKEDWEVAIYPVEPHGFIQPSSWYDEYRRISELFRRHLGK
jgi:dipeptidyl aminopeptidase/acylaminoacyl peptidase